MRKNLKTKILDCTTRDCGYNRNWNFSDEEIFELMSDLNKNSISFYEIGYRNFYENENKGKFYYCTPDLIKKFYSNKGNLKLGVMVDTKRYNENDFINAEIDYLDFIRIASHPDRIADTLKISENLYHKGYNVMVQLMDITNLEDIHFEILKKWDNKNILGTIYLADTYGIISTNDLEFCYKKLKNSGYENISFHAHNQTNRALANSIKAIELGAYSIDVTQDGRGINGGNLSFKEFQKQ